MNICEMFKDQAILTNYIFFAAFIGIILLLAGYFSGKKIFYLYFFYFITIAGIFLLKIFNRNTATINLSWILAPVSLLTELLTGLNFHPVAAGGYVYPPLNIIIDKSCAGINFLIVSLMLTIYSRLKTSESLKKTGLHYIILLIFSYSVTIFANSLRITGAILITRLLQSIDRMDLYHQLHHAEGIVVYLSMLIIYYLLLEKINIFHHQQQPVMQ